MSACESAIRDVRHMQARERESIRVFVSVSSQTAHASLNNQALLSSKQSASGIAAQHCHTRGVGGKSFSSSQESADASALSQ